jgi:transposase
MEKQVLNRRKDVELFEAIRREYQFGEGTVKGVARKFGVHRRMVREALADAVPKQRKIIERARPKLEPAVAFIDEILESDLKAPRKQRHTAHRIYNRLLAEKPEIKVAEATVRAYVRSQKVKIGLIHRETFVPQSYTWGQEGQVDWYEMVAELGGERQKVQIFCLRSMAGAGAFHHAYPHASQQAFLEAHELAFHYFGGVFRLLRYDNLRSAVQKILRGSQREETARFVAFRSHWGYEAEFCTPARGNEKGGVEGEGGFFRRNHLTPVPAARDYAHLNELLREASVEDERRVVGERTVSVGAAMALEREHLLPLAKEGFDLAAVRFPAVNTSGCIKVLTNSYSVPLAAGTEVEAKIHATYIEVWRQGKCVARHERCFGRQQKVLDLNHYLEALERKPGALAGATALEQWRAQGKWPASYDRYWEGLKQRQGKQAGTRAMIEILLEGQIHGAERLRQAVERALELGCSDKAAVEYLLREEKAEKQIPEAIELGALLAYERPQPTMAAYDQLLQNTAVEVIQ